MPGLLLALLALQAPFTLEESGSCDLSTQEVPALVPSRTGKWIAIHSPAEIQVLEAGSFKPVRRLAVAASALSFDAADAALTVVGATLRRYDTKTWNGETLVEFHDGESPSPGSALLLDGGQAWYRNLDGGITMLWMDGKDWKRKALPPPAGKAREPVVRFWADAGAAVLASVSAERRAGGLILDGKFLELPSCEQTIVAFPTKSGAVFVAPGSVAVFEAPSWKLAWRDGVNRNLAAAIDAAAGVVYVSRAEGLWAFDAATPDKTWRCERVTRPFSGMAVDPAGRRLYGISGQTVRCWTIKASK